MRYIILLVALTSCIEVELNICKKHIFNMTISDALPIQFWVNGVETFNEKSECGINEACFCLPIECDDEITVQFIGDEGFQYGLEITGEASQTIALESSGNVYSASFMMSDFDICNLKVRLEIIVISTIPVSDFDNGGLSALPDFWQVGGGGNNWSAGDDPYIPSPSTAAISNTIGGNTRTIFHPQNISIGDLISITGSARISGANDNTTIQILGLNSNGTTILGSQVIGNTPTPFSYSGIANENYEYVGAIVIRDTNQSIYIRSFQSEVESRIKSDCLNVRESHECTKLIEYSNESDFDGIVYSDISPRPTFYLRIPAMFFEEDNPQEQEDLVLSNGVIVTLRQEIQEKRLLETGYMPNYMHKKLQKVLMHESKTIDGDGWKRRDPYEANPIKKYSLKKASVQLTKYNSVLKNTI